MSGRQRGSWSRRAGAGRCRVGQASGLVVALALVATSGVVPAVASPGAAGGDGVGPGSSSAPPTGSAPAAVQASGFDGCALPGSGVACPPDPGTTDQASWCFLDPRPPGDTRRISLQVTQDGTVITEIAASSSWCSDWAGAGGSAVVAMTGSDAAGWDSEVLSRPAGGGWPDGESWGPQATPDGRHVVFTSAATNLTATTDDNGAPDVFLVDRDAGTITLLSRGLDGTAAEGVSRDPSISSDGRWVAFSSVAEDLVGPEALYDNGGVEDVFLYDTQTGALSVVSLAEGNAPADGDSGEPAVAATMWGPGVAFSSEATDLVHVPGDVRRDVFYWQAFGDDAGTVQVSHSADGASWGPSLADTRSLVFTSAGSDLVVPDANGVSDVFLAGPPTWVPARAVSAHDGSGEPDGASDQARITPDGARLVFRSTAGNLVEPGLDANLAADVYMRDLTGGGSTELVSVGEEGGEGAFVVPDANPLLQPGGTPAVSPDGRFVGFLWDQGYGLEVWRRDRTPRSAQADPVLDLVTQRPDGDPFPIPFTGGRYSASWRSGAPGSWGLNGPDVSADGDKAAFYAGDAAGAVEDDANGVDDWFLRDTGDRVSQRVAAPSSATATWSESVPSRQYGSGLGALSPDGQWLRGWWRQLHLLDAVWPWVRVERNVATGEERQVPLGGIEDESPGNSWFVTNPATCQGGSTWCSAASYLKEQPAFSDDASRVLWRSAARFYNGDEGFAGPPNQLPWAEQQARWGNFGRPDSAETWDRYFALLQGTTAVGEHVDVPVESAFGLPSWKRTDWQASRNFLDAEDVRGYALSPDGRYGAVVVIEALPEGTPWNQWPALGGQYRVRVLRVSLPDGNATALGAGETRVWDGRGNEEGNLPGVAGLRLDNDGNVAWVGKVYPGAAPGDASDWNLYVNGRQVNVFDTDGPGGQAPVRVGIPVNELDVRRERRLVMAPQGGRVAFLGHLGIDPEASLDFAAAPAPDMFLYDVDEDGGGGVDATAAAVTRFGVGGRNTSSWFWDDNPAPELFSMTDDGRVLLAASAPRMLDRRDGTGWSQLYLAGPADFRPAPMIKTVWDPTQPGRLLLDGSGSWDPDGHIATHEWKVNGAAVAASPEDSALATVDLADYVDLGDESFWAELTVTDDRGASMSRYVDLPVPAPPPGIDVGVELSAPERFVVGRPDAYAVTVTNVAAGATTGPVRVVVDLPHGIEFAGFAGDGWECGPEYGDVVCDHPAPLASGEQAAVLEIQADVMGWAVPEVTTTVSVATDGDANPANDDASVTTPVLRGYDLNVDAVLTPAFRAGEAGVYHLRVANDGDVESPVPVLRTSLPNGVTYLGWRGAAWSCGAVLSDLLCGYEAPLAPGEEADLLSIDVMVDVSAVPLASNVFTLDAEGDVNPNDNFTVLVIPVVGPDVGVVLTGPASAVPGEAAQYEVAVGNGAAAAATAGPVTVVDVLPIGLSYAGFSGAGWACGALGDVVTCAHVGPLGPGEAAPPLTLDVTVGAAAVPSVTNTVAVSTPGDVNADNDSSSVSTSVSASGGSGDDDGDGIPDPFDPDGGTVAFNRALVRMVSEGPLSHLSLADEAGEKAWMPRRAHPGIVLPGRDRLRPGGGLPVGGRTGVLAARVGDAGGGVEPASRLCGGGRVVPAAQRAFLAVRLGRRLLPLPGPGRGRPGGWGW